MTHLKNLAPMIVLLVLLVAGCSDDDPVTPPAEPFAVTVSVVDGDGQPVVDRPVSVIPVLPDGVLQDGKALMPAAVVIPFDVPAVCVADMVIRDVAGTTIRTLVDEYPAMVGEHRVMWNGQDDDGEHQNTGWYEVVLTCSDADTDTVMFTDTVGMLMVLVDSDQAPYRTGDDGQVTIDDRRVVPAFWDVPPLTFTNEESDPIGEYTLTVETWILVGGRYVEFTAVDGPQSVTVDLSKSMAMPIGTRRRAASDGGNGGIVDVFSIGDPYPNPFN